MLEEKKDNNIVTRFSEPQSRKNIVGFYENKELVKPR